MGFSIKDLIRKKELIEEQIGAAVAQVVCYGDTAISPESILDIFVDPDTNEGVLVLEDGVETAVFEAWGPELKRIGIDTVVWEQAHGVKLVASGNKDSHN